MRMQVADGGSPLYIACLRGHYDVVALLLEKDRGLTRLKTINDWTVLHVACEHGHTRVASLLMDADPQLALMFNEGGKLPLQVAIGNNHVDIVDMILSRVPTLAIAEIEYFARMCNLPQCVKIIKRHREKSQHPTQVSFFHVPSFLFVTLSHSSHPQHMRSLTRLHPHRFHRGLIVRQMKSSSLLLPLATSLF